MPTTRNLCLLTFSICISPFLFSCATSPEALSTKAEMRMERAAELLAKRTDADSQAAAALLVAGKHAGQSLRLVAQASLVAPERADLVWLHIQFCQADASCDPEPLEGQLRILDKANGAGWLGALARANKRSDEQSKSAALAAIGRSDRLDIYWTTLIARLSHPIASTKVVSLAEAEIYVIGVLAAETISAYQVLSNACKGERLRHDDVVETCRGIANALLQGDTTITEMMGAAIAKRVWPENSTKWVEADEARRIWDYRAQLLIHAETWVLAHPSDYLTLCEQNHREHDLIKAELIASGKNSDPPPIKNGSIQ